MYYAEKHSPNSSIDYSLRSKEDTSLAYFIQVSSSTLDHLPRLLDRIWEPSNCYAIHVDAKVDGGEYQMLRERIYNQHKSYKGNIYFMQREPVTYAGISMVLNTLNAMQLLLEKKLNWNYFINLSGSDYPILSAKHQRFLLANGPHRANYFHLCDQAHANKSSKHRLGAFYVDHSLGFTNRTGSLQYLGMKNPIHARLGFVYVKAEAWMVTSRSFASYATSSPSSRKLLAASSYSKISDEMFFPTLAYNSNFNETIVPTGLRSVFWSKPNVSMQERQGYSPFYVDENINGTWPWLPLIENSNGFFVRKIREPNSPIMDKCDIIANSAKTFDKLKKRFVRFKAGTESRKHEQPNNHVFT